MQIECVTKTPALLGESPVWSVGEQALYWVDITGRALHRFDPASGEDRDWPLPEEIGCVVPRREGGLIVGLRHGIAFFDPATGTLERLVDPEADRPGNRFNDGTTDSVGRLWAGTMSMDLQAPQPQGTFYRFDPDRSCHAFFSGIFVCNGLAFSPDGRTMYLAETHPSVRTIWACDYDVDDGVPTNRRVFVDTRGLSGRPDGGSCDADGCYWTAAIDGGQIIRFTPQGKVDRVIDLPVKTPTKAAFGGARLDTLYVTSLQRAGRNDLGRDAGALFAIHGVGATGIEITPFPRMSDDKPKGLAGGLTHYGDPEFSLYLRRSFARSMGYGDAMLRRPIVGIAYPPSGFNNCHRHFPELIEAVKRGVLTAGALPLEFPTVSLGEAFLSPTSLKFRNLMAMDVEAMIAAQPIDAVVLMGGCDKTVPAQLMGAASADRPAVQLVAGPMMTGSHAGHRLGACTDCRRFWARFRAGEIDRAEIDRIEGNLATTAGTCAVMGTASSMACIAEAIGMALPNSATIPAVHADRLRCAEATGALAAGLVGSDRRPSRIITEKSVENALRVLLAIGGSTNAVIHLAAIAGRRGIALSLPRLNQLSDSTPVLVNLKPVGEHYMEDLNAAGGLGAVLHELKPLLHLDCLTVTGETLGERLDRQPPRWVDRSAIRPADDPIEPVGGLVALFGSLAPGGAILKRSAADKSLFERTGRAVVFSSLEDLAARIDDPALDVTPDDFLVLQNAGPQSAVAMPEAGYLPIPRKLAARGLKDMVRISDARMSGTAFGTVILHVTPEAAIGGPLALVEPGDRIRLSVAERRLDLLVDDAVLSDRRRRFEATAAARPSPLRGYDWLYQSHVLQADRGCDFDFLTQGGRSARA